MAKQDMILTVASLLRKRVVVKHDPMCSSGHTLTVTSSFENPSPQGSLAPQVGYQTLVSGFWQKVQIQTSQI